MYIYIERCGLALKPWSQIPCTNMHGIYMQKVWALTIHLIRIVPSKEQRGSSRPFSKEKGLGFEPTISSLLRNLPAKHQASLDSSEGWEQIHYTPRKCSSWLSGRLLTARVLSASWWLFSQLISGESPSFSCFQPSQQFCSSLGVPWLPLPWTWGMGGAC